MKRIQRINRVSRKRPPRQSKLLPVVIVIAAGALGLQLALVRALLIDLQYHGAVEGASGITQQIVKQKVLSDQRSVQRKLQEILIAYAVSRPHSGFTKNDILSLYLNTVFFGHQANGVEAAARVFFGKDVWKLDLAQCALLAGLVQAPSAYHPLGPHGPARADARMRSVLDRI